MNEQEFKLFINKMKLKHPNQIEIFDKINDLAKSSNYDTSVTKNLQKLILQCSNKPNAIQMLAPMLNKLERQSKRPYKFEIILFVICCIAILFTILYFRHWFVSRQFNDSGEARSFELGRDKYSGEFAYGFFE